jgi:hypothetical protein
MKKWASVTDPITMERKRVLKKQILFIFQGYYKGPAYGVQKQKNREKKYLKDSKVKNKKRCCCIVCGKEVSNNNLERHLGTKVCLDKKAYFLI